MPSRSNYTTDHARRLGYRSGFESDVAKELDKLGVDYDYESALCQFPYYKSIVKGFCTTCESKEVKQLCNYTCDFALKVSDVAIMFIETKGRFTASDRAKMELITKMHSDYDIRILFQYDGKATPKRSYTEWCEWKGIRCAVINKRKKEYIPREWLRELGCNV
jgi:hypothetical protein